MLQCNTIISVAARKNVMIFYRETVETKLMELRRAIPDGNTNLYFGLEKVNNLIKVFGRQRASVVILLTDGILHYADKRLSVEKVIKVLLVNQVWFDA